MATSIDDQPEMLFVNDSPHINETVDLAAKQLTFAMKREIYLYTVPILCCLCLLAVIANLVVLIVGRMIKSAHNCSTTITFTRGLAAADCWTSIVIAVGLVVNSYFPYVKGFSVSLCVSVAIESLRLGAITTSVLFLLAIAINHRVITGRAHKSDTNWLNKKLSWAVIAAMCILPPVGFLVGFSSMQGGAFRSNGTCAASDILKGLPLRLLLFLLTAIPLLVLVAIYLQIVTRLRGMDNRFASNTQKRPLENRRASAVARRIQTTLAAKNRRRMVSTALLIICSFLIGWMPGSLYFLLSCDICPFYYRNLPPLVAISAGIFITVPMILKGIINPAIYAQRIPEFRDAFSVLRRRTSSYSYNSILSKGSLTSSTNPFRASMKKPRNRIVQQPDKTTFDFDNEVLLPATTQAINRSAHTDKGTIHSNNHEPVTFNSMNDQLL